MKLEISQDYDEDEIWLFERIVSHLKADHAHTHEKSIELVNSYYGKFTNEEFCHIHGIPAQNIDFFCHIESVGMADRVHYYEALFNTPNEDEFIQWQRKFRLQ
ncbi:hypothetical protein [Undibacterium sp. Di24W]|uniref:hypothetical protein n=1 Tax=Undibacterium sp. Di24W TaxID=3413033 RepID=UPI003BF36FB2